MWEIVLFQFYVAISSEYVPPPTIFRNAYCTPTYKIDEYKKYKYIRILY